MLRRSRACPPPSDSADAGVPWHYGNPHAEWRALMAGEATVDLSHRAVLRIAGSDRRTWLHTITTAHLTDLATARWATSLVLSPHGHVEHELHLIDTDDATFVITERATKDGLIAYLDSMRFMLDVAIQDASADVAVVGAGAAYEVDDLPRWRVPPAFATLEAPDQVSATYVPLRPDIWPVQEFLVPRGDLSTRIAVPAGTWAWEAARIAAGVPRFGLETDHRTIPHEVGWVPTAVHLDKGCYRGQETVARVHNLGKPPRRLVLLHLDRSDDALPVHGSPVSVGDRAVGRITSATRHPETGPLALAVIKRNTPVDLELQIGDGRASQEIVVVA